MKRVTIPAGSTPSEKEHGQWVKLTNTEALWLFSVVNCIQSLIDLMPEAEAVRITTAAKLEEAVRAA